MITFFFYGLAPLIAFAIIDALSNNVRWAVFCAVILSLAELLVMYLSTNRLDPVSLTATLLFVALGFLSIRLEKRIYFKLQPAVVALIAAAFIAYLQFGGQPLVYRYLPLLKQTALPFLQPYLENDQFLQWFNSLVNWFIVIILLEGAWIAYAAMRCRQITWLLVNAFGLWILGVLMVLAQIAYLYLMGINPVSS